MTDHCTPPSAGRLSLAPLGQSAARLWGLLPLAALALGLGLASPALAQSRPPGTGGPSAPAAPGTSGPTAPAAPGTSGPAQRTTAPPPARATTTPSPAPALSGAAVQQAVEATATALDVVATVVAATVTALVVPTAPPTALAATPIPTGTLTASSTPTATASSTATATPQPTVNPLASSRTVLTTAPISVGGETFAPGAPLEIPINVTLQDGAIPPGTTIRLPDGQVIALPVGTSIPAVENAAIVGTPLNAVLPRAGLVGDVSTPPGAVVMLPSGITAYGTLAPDSSVLLPSGAVVQMGGRSHTLVEPLQVVISGTPVDQPAVLPATGDAELIFWPAGLGVLLLVGGWRLRRSS